MKLEYDIKEMEEGFNLNMQLEYNIKEIEEELNLNMQNLKIIHPDMKVKEDFSFETHEGFMKFLRTYIKITRIGNKQAKGDKIYRNILMKINNYVYTILFHYYKYARNEKDRKEYEKHLRYICPIIFK